MRGYTGLPVHPPASKMNSTMDTYPMPLDDGKATEAVPVGPAKSTGTWVLWVAAVVSILVTLYLLGR